MRSPDVLPVLVLGGVKHLYIVQALAAHPRFELVALADEEVAPAWVHQRNEAAASAFGLPYVRGISGALARYRPRVACVTPETGRHARLSVMAAEAGLHIVQDKPMALTLAECDRLVAAVEAADVRFLMWNRNTFPSILQAREVLAGGSLGDPRAVHVDFFFAKDAGVLLGSGEPEEIPLGHEVLGELTVEGIYPLAYIHALLRVPVRRVFARTTAHFFQRHAEGGVEDLASVTLEMGDGTLGSVCIGRIGEPSHPNIGELRLHILGTRGAFVVAEPRPEISVYARSLKAEDHRQRRVGADYERRLLDDFARAIDTGSGTPMTAQDSRAIAATVFAAVESGRTGRPVEVARG